MGTRVEPNPTDICLCGCGLKTPLATRTRARSGDIAGKPRRFAKGTSCSNRYRTGFTDWESRFWAYVDADGGLDACWPWRAWISRHGQGQFAITTNKHVGAHRVAFVLARGFIPAGMPLDHLCHTADPSCLLANACPHRSCCNPWHLEPVTPRENVLRSHTAPPAINARKTRCIRGHEFAGENLAWTPKGARVCRECDRAKARRRAADSRMPVER